MRKKTKDIVCTKESRSLEGSCNACQRRDKDEIVLISTRTLSVRLCEDCANVLAAQLEEKLGLVACMRNVLKNIINDLPTSRDWLDPTTEKIAREYAEK